MVNNAELCYNSVKIRHNQDLKLREMSTMSDEIDIESSLKVLNQMAGSIAWVDTQGKFILANEQYAHLGGYKNLDSLVDTIYEEMPLEGCELSPHWREHDKIAIATQQTLKMVTYLELNGSNDRCLMLGIKNPRYNANNEIIGTCGQYFDITNSHLFSGVALLSEDLVKKVGKNENGAWVYLLEEGFANLEENLKLTERQSEVLFFMLRGKTAAEIGATLYLSKRTVETYINQLKERLDCPNKSALIECAIALGFLQKIPARILSGKINL